MRLSIAQAKRLGLHQAVAAIPPAGDGKTSASRPSPALRAPRRPACPPDAERRPQPAGDVCFTVPAAAVPKERPRTVFAGTHTYTPRRTRAFARLVADFARPAMMGLAPFTGPVEVEITFVVAVPRSWDVRRRAEALDGKILPTVRPDLDNTAKNVMDALCGLVFKDDALICRKLVEKVYGAEAEVRVRIAGLPARGTSAPRPQNR